MQPEIFKLNVDCFDDIFDYLSTEDLVSFGQTCKVLQRVAGEYFKENYSADQKYLTKNGVNIIFYGDSIRYCIEEHAFNPFITCLKIQDEAPESLQYIGVHSNEFASLNAIEISFITLNELDINCIQKCLPKLEFFKLFRCKVNGDIYDALLKHCANLKELQVEGALTVQPNGSANRWLLHEYPLLETVHLIQSASTIIELPEFFTKNPKIHTFSTTMECLVENADALIDKVKLTNLKLHYDDGNVSRNIQPLCSLLNKLYEHQFYKHLHLEFIHLRQEYCDEMTSLHGLESIQALLISNFVKCDLSHLTSVKNLKLLRIAIGGIPDTEVLAKGLINLRRIFIKNATFDDIMKFVSHSKKLKEIEIYLRHDEKLPIDLAKLNQQRQCLMDACKVIIYVRKDVFLNAKWTAKNGNLNLNLVEMRRFK